MRSRRVLGALSLFLAALFLVLFGIFSPIHPAGRLSPAEAADTRPNILLIVTDDQTVDDLKVMKKTRRILGTEGTTFENAFATEPLCCPARTTMLTGQYSHNHRVLTNVPPYGSISAFEGRDNTLPVWLHNAGYRTGFVGKYLNGPTLTSPETGWDYWVSPIGSETEVMKMFDYDLLTNTVSKHFGTREDQYKTDVFTNRAELFLKSVAGKGSPFLLTIFDVAPHDANLAKGRDPLPAPRHKNEFLTSRFTVAKKPSYNEKDVSDKASWNQEGKVNSAKGNHFAAKWRDRRASLLAVDDQVESIVRLLNERKVLGNTLIIFTSDNGYLSGEHRLGAKARPYEESIRVPMLVRGPGFTRGAKNPNLVAHHDITKTIVDATGVTPGRTLDGNNLLGPARQELLLECFACMPAGDITSSWQMIRTPSEAYVSYPEDGQSETYDLTSDPYELIGSRTSKSAPLAQALSHVAKCVGNACP